MAKKAQEEVFASGQNCLWRRTNLYSLKNLLLLLLFTLQYCIGFATHQHESAPVVHVFLIPNPPPTIPPGHPSAPAPGILHPALNLAWRFISYMILYMSQCHSPKSSHPLLISQSPKELPIHMCLFCCLTYRVIITIFLNSIYMC